MRIYYYSSPALLIIIIQGEWIERVDFQSMPPTSIRHPFPSDMAARWRNLSSSSSSWDSWDGWSGIKFTSTAQNSFRFIVFQKCNLIKCWVLVIPKTDFLANSRQRYLIGQWLISSTPIHVHPSCRNQLTDTVDKIIRTLLVTGLRVETQSGKKLQ